MSDAVSNLMSDRISIVDTHTGGEPTRVIVDGGPDLGSGSLIERRGRFREQFDHFRSAVVHEPRGSEVMVGALLCPPVDPHSVAGVIFFNNVGYLNMCGHGTMGVAVVLAHLGRIGTGRHQLETPAGPVGIEIEGRNRVTIENVPAFRFRHGVTVDVEGHGPVTGDVAWGGNWFFIVEQSRPLTSSAIPEWTEFANRVRRALVLAAVTGVDGAEIDHIELSGPAENEHHDSRNFVLCPGGAYDRSPCGTGTSAKLACLHAEGKLKPGETYRQASIIGSLFEGQVRIVGEQIIPRITGTAYVNAEATLLLDPDDPFRFGIPVCS